MRQNAPALSMRSRREKRKPIPLPEKRSLRLDENAADSWDTPIRCSSKTEDVLAAYIRDDLTYYKNEEGCTAVWVWAEQVGDGQYELFIGRG